ncbi:MAG TPA: hypothetical protein EYP85_07205 [Armatimonadetes bacterium]|nr:hypothetical protein [Armatimonadota bacterium]
MAKRKRTTPKVKVIREYGPMIVLVWFGDLVERMDPGFWNPKWLEYERYKKYPLRTLGDYQPFITYGAIVPHQKPLNLRDWRKGVLRVGQKQLTDVVLDLTEAIVVEEGSRWDVPRARIEYLDLLFPRSGVGSLGKARVAVWLLEDASRKAVVDCFVDIVRLPKDKIRPEYVAVYIKTRFGRMQINRWLSGVGTINVDFDDIRNFHLHVIPMPLQNQIAFQYHSLVRCHDIATEAKARMLRCKEQGNLQAAERPRREYKRNLKAAEAMLADLVRQVEEVIEGTRTEIEPVTRILETEEVAA